MKNKIQLITDKLNIWSLVENKFKIFNTIFQLSIYDLRVNFMYFILHQGDSPVFKFCFYIITKHEFIQSKFGKPLIKHMTLSGSNLINSTEVNII